MGSHSYILHILKINFYNACVYAVCLCECMPFVCEASGDRERALDSLQLWLQELGVVPGD